MAEKDDQKKSTSDAQTRLFDNHLNKDVKDFHLKENEWTFARNAINNSKTGDLGKLGNEPSTLYCTSAPYPIIGAIHLEADKWAIFSTNDTDCEIGFFEEGLCRYTKIVNDQCLNFRKTNLIKGVSRETSDCSHILYWDDGRNPSRYLDIGDIKEAPYTQDCLNPWPNIPYKCVDSVVSGGFDCEGNPQNCFECIPLCPLQLDCDKIRLSPLMDRLCFSVKKGVSGGSLLNGSYFVVGTYTIKDQKMTDYFIPSNIQPIFHHSGSGGSIEITVENADTQYFDQFELVVISIISQQVTARRVGFYSTKQKRITLDIIDNTLPTIPIEQIPIRTPIIDKSDAMYSVNEYLLRVGPTSKFDFNYQPLANRIVAKWQSVEYPANYYVRGGNKTGYMSDEVYAFFIRWKYDTGDVSASYHIPGRPQRYNEDACVKVVPDALNSELVDGDNYNWVVNNLATITNVNVNTVLPDGGIVRAEGYMGYWESTEMYPDNKPEIWNANLTIAPYPFTSPSDYDLCGRAIRHHKFPDRSIITIGTPAGYPHPDLQMFRFDPGTGQNVIRLLGVKFSNIFPPVDNDGNPIPGIIGYEILRGSRNGNKTVIAKGIINNVVKYDIPDDAVSGKTGLFPNYPYNDLQGDHFLKKVRTRSLPALAPRSNNFGYKDEFGNAIGAPPLSGPVEDMDSDSDYSFVPDDYLKNIFTFHSPETTFANPFLTPNTELKVYQNLYGMANMKYQYPAYHPKHKVFKDIGWLMASIAGLGIGTLAGTGKTTKTNVARGTFGTGLNYLYQDPSGVIPWGTVLGQEGFGANLLFNGNIVGFGLANALGIGGTGVDNPSFSVEASGMSAMSPIFTLLFNTLGGSPLFSYYWAEGTETTWRLIKAAGTDRQYALQQMSHCYYNNNLDGGIVGDFALMRNIGQHRRTISNINYLDGQIQDFGMNYRVNNLYRSETVILRTDLDLEPPFFEDKTRFNTRIKDLAINQSSLKVYDNPEVSFQRKSSTYYAAIKQRLRNQYGQINSILQIPVECTIPLNPDTYIQTTPSLFGGDIYINRYTEKNTFFYFYDWLNRQPDGTPFSYHKYRMLPYPTYWMDIDDFSVMEGVLSISEKLNSQYIFNQTAAFFIAVTQWLTDLIQYVADAATGNSTSFPDFNWSPGNPLDDLVLPSDYYVLDRPLGKWYIGNKFTGAFSSGPAMMLRDGGPGPIVKYGYFYLFNSGVRDFYVESEYNLAYRDWGNEDGERHYDPYRYTNLPALFNTDIIKVGNYNKYDDSLSIAKNWYSYVNWGNVQDSSYNPVLSENCYQYRPDRIIYSLPSQFENKRDNWRIFLPNNYKDFLSRVTAVKQINKSGALILFESDSPTMFQGLDQLQTDLGTKLTIGDGGLFSQPMQNIMNADRPYEYASCQNRLSIINTPVGTYWISQNQGKIFQLGNNIKEISNERVKWWFAQYLPYQLTKYFPNFSLVDNPVAGIGCQSMYDNENSLVYFTKKDYVPVSSDPCLIFNEVTQQFELDLTQCNGVPQVPGCPQGYTYNMTTGKCERYVDYVNDPLCPQGYTYDPVNQTCTLTTTTPINQLPCPVDLYFVLDTSDSVADPDPNTGGISERQIFVDVAAQVLLQLQSQIQSGAVRVGLVGFATGAQVFQELTSNGTLIADAFTQWKNQPWPWPSPPPNQGATNISKGLNFAWYGLHYDILSRPTASKKIILMTDGFQNVPCNCTGAGAQADSCWVADCFPPFGPAVGAGPPPNTNYGLYVTSYYMKFGGTFPVCAIPTPAGGWIPTEIITVGTGVASEITDAQDEWLNISSPGKVYINTWNNLLQYVSSIASDVCGTCPPNCTQVGNDCVCTDIIPANAPCDPACTTVTLPNGNAYCRCIEEIDPIYQNVTVPVSLCDPNYFKDISWTISYDPKIEGWLGWHDWHPDLMLPSKNTFMSIKNEIACGQPNPLNNGIWIHNKLCDSYNNYYTINYPFEVEYTVNTIQEVNTLRSIEYQLEVYRYNSENCFDRFHKLDMNFDEAVIYNTEQCSGLLRLNLTPKNNPLLIMDYPLTVSAGPQLGGFHSILYSKEENKYRFNQFWDTTHDRAEFPIGSAYPPPTPNPGSYAERPIWNTELNGYIRNLNAVNLDYSKDPTQRKRFRHYTTSVFLRRKAAVAGVNEYKMLVSIVNNKTLNSPR